MGCERQDKMQRQATNKSHQNDKYTSTLPLTTHVPCALEPPNIAISTRNTNTQTVRAQNVSISRRDDSHHEICDSFDAHKNTRHGPAAAPIAHAHMQIDIHYRHCCAPTAHTEFGGEPTVQTVHSTQADSRTAQQAHDMRLRTQRVVPKITSPACECIIIDAVKRELKTFENNLLFDSLTRSE